MCLWHKMQKVQSREYMLFTPRQLKFFETTTVILFLCTFPEMVCVFTNRFKCTFFLPWQHLYRWFYILLSSLMVNLGELFTSMHTGTTYSIYPFHEHPRIHPAMSTSVTSNHFFFITEDDAVNDLIQMQFHMQEISRNCWFKEFM